MSITSAIKNFKEDLQHIQQTTQQLMPQIPDNPLKTELQDVLKKIEEESEPLIEELKNLSLLTNVVQSLRRENKKLQGQTKITEQISLLQQENQRLQQQIEMLLAEDAPVAFPQSTQMLSMQEKILMAKNEPVSTKDSEKLPLEIVQNDAPATDRESQSVDYSSEELYGESETLGILQIEEEELNELVQRRRLSVEEKDKQRFFLKREVEMLRKISMESATMLVPKTKQD